MTTTGDDERQLLWGHLLRDHDHAIATLKAARENQNLTRKALARKVGCALTSLSYWEHGRTWPTAGNLFALAAALGYDLALVPRDADAPPALRPQPQTAEQASGVPGDAPDDSDEAQTLSGWFIVPREDQA